jgi:hypothetical protein
MRLLAACQVTFACRAQSPTVTVPAGTKVLVSDHQPGLVQFRPARQRRLRPNCLPVTVDNQIAVPTGTYAEGRIDILI